MKKKWNKKSGFTLIEVLVVLAIIGVLFILILPALASTRERAHAVNCMNNMKQIAIAAFLYADDHSEAIPEIALYGSVDPNECLVNSNYIDDKDAYICPRDTRPGLGVTILSSYAACTSTPKSFLPSELGGLSSETIMYIESNRAGESGFNRDNIIADLRKNVDEESEGYLELRHDDRTVIVFADGHIFSMNEEQLISLHGIWPGEHKEKW